MNKLKPPTTLMLSHSTLNSLQGCKRCYILKEHEVYFADHLADSIAVAVGTCLHAAWQDYLIHRDRDRAFEVLFNHYPWHLHKKATIAYRWWVVYTAFKTVISDVILANGWEVFIKPDGDPAIETQFAINLQGFHLPEGAESLWYTGHIDAIIKDHEGNIFPIDFKTTTMSVLNSIHKLENSLQLVPYVYFVNQKYREHNPVNRECYVISTLSDKPETYTTRRTVSRGLIRQWIQRVEMALAHLHICYKNNWFPATPDTHPYGKGICTYFDDYDVSSNERILRALHGKDAREAWDEIQIERASKLNKQSLILNRKDWLDHAPTFID